MLGFLANIKLQTILIIVIVAMAGSLAVLWNQMLFHKYESVRKGDNFVALQELEKEKTAHLEFRSTREIEDYVDSNEDLKKLLDESEVKLKRANSIIYQKQVYIDNIERSTDVSELVDNIRKNTYAKKEWQDSTACLVIQGNVEFKDSKLNVNITDREFDNDIAIIGTWVKHPRTWFAKVLGLGRKIPSVTATSKCGDSKTVVIERTEKK